MADKIKKANPPPYGAIAQLGERIVRNDEVVGSSPTSSTNIFNPLQLFLVGESMSLKRIEARRESAKDHCSCEPN